MWFMHLIALWTRNKHMTIAIFKLTFTTTWGILLMLVEDEPHKWKQVYVDENTGVLSVAYFDLFTWFLWMIGYAIMNTGV